MLHETHLCARGASAIEFRGNALHVCSSSEEAVPAEHPSYAQAYAGAPTSKAFVSNPARDGHTMQSY